MTESKLLKLKKLFHKMLLIISLILAIIVLVIVLVILNNRANEQMKAENIARQYIKEKYSFDAVVISTKKLAAEKRNLDSYLIQMNYDFKEFLVKVSLADPSIAADDYQLETVINNFKNQVLKIINVEPSEFKINYARGGDTLFLHDYVTETTEVFKEYPIYAIFLYQHNLNLENYRSQIENLFNHGFISLINFQNFDLRDKLKDGRKTFEFKADIKAYGAENLPYIKNGIEISKEPKLEPNYTNLSPNNIKVNHGIYYYVADKSINLQFTESGQNIESEYFSIEGDARRFKILSKTYTVDLPEKRVYIYFPVAKMINNNYLELEAFVAYTPINQEFVSYVPLGTYTFIQKEIGGYYVFKIEQNWQRLEFKMIANDAEFNKNN